MTNVVAICRNMGYTVTVPSPVVDFGEDQVLMSILFPCTETTSSSSSSSLSSSSSTSTPAAAAVTTKEKDIQRKKVKENLLAFQKNMCKQGSVWNVPVDTMLFLLDGDKDNN